jgi:TPR repeat protein
MKKIAMPIMLVALALIASGCVSVRELTARAIALDADAQYELAQFYRRGGRVPQNHRLADKLIVSSASLGHVAAMYELAYMYYGGEGVKKDAIEACAWLTLAVDRNKNHKHELKLMRALLDPRDLPKLNARTAELNRKVPKN